MFKMITLSIKRVSDSLIKPYKRILNVKSDIGQKSTNNIGGITSEDWLKIGNDMRRKNNVICGLSGYSR